MARKKGKEDAMNEEVHRAPLPLEAEEGAVQLKWGQWVSVAFGAAFLAIAIYMIFQILPVLQQSPGLPYPEIPLLSTAFFVIGAVGDLTVAVTARPGALELWHEGKFAESDHYLLGWRAYLTVVAGGVLPGFFLFRAADRVQPLVELERGGLPPPGMYPPQGPGPTMAAPPPQMGMGYGVPPPRAPPPGGPGDDSVAPNPMGGSSTMRGPPPMPRSGGGSPWSRPSTPSYDPPPGGSS